MKLRFRACDHCGRRYPTSTAHRTCGRWPCEQATFLKERSRGADVEETPSEWKDIGHGGKKRVNWRELDSEEREWEAHDEQEND